MENIVLNEKQQYIYEKMMEGHNIFLTGEAGTGKSTVLNEFIKHNQNKKIVICAPSGIAAINIGGVTMHRAFQIPLSPCPKNKKGIPKIIKEADIIIIDEISMCRLDVFDFVAEIIFKEISRREKEDGYAILQTIVVGDFFQLPPVLMPEHKKILDTYYECDVKNAFAFQSKYWEKFYFKAVQLTEVMRQNDIDFINALNKIRYGVTEALDYFSSNASKEEIKEGIIVCSKNQLAKDINEQKLKELTSPSKKYFSKIKGEVKESDKPTDDLIELKVGARIMMLTNHKEGLWLNGSLGTVEKLNDKSIEVILDNGNKAHVEMHSFQIEKYVIMESVNENGDPITKLEKEIIGIFKQFPIKLAYAITIHKSQGQTYDAVNLHPLSWSPGQLYVALSRAKSIDKLHLLSYLSPKFLISAPEVIEFYQNTINDFNVIQIKKPNEIIEKKKKSKKKIEMKSIKVPVDLIPEIKKFIKEYVEKIE